VAAGQINLAGTLSVQLDNGFRPGMDDQYTVVSSGGPRMGMFDMIDPPPGWMVDPVYDEMSLTIRLSAGELTRQPLASFSQLR
jgi:hypothetical protein